MTITTKHIFFLGLALVLLSVGNSYLAQRNQPTSVVTNGLIQEDEVSYVDLGNPDIEVDNAMMEIITSDMTLLGDLQDVTGGDSSGTAYILRKDSKLYHVVEAQLPSLEDGSVYEGWLVDKTKSNAFFSSGVMKPSGIEGLYTLSFESENSYSDYNFVVITKEKNVDEKPETHILEGLVKLPENKE